MKREIESLNLNDVDVEELERRIELGQMIPLAQSPDEGFACDIFYCTYFRPS